jgi:GNAT superfamily N-acetyltransferase
MLLAVRAGAKVFELADDDSTLATARVTVRRMQLWNGTAVGRLSHGMSSLRRRGKTISGQRPIVQKSALSWMLDAFAEARPESARKIVERLGNKTMHLYRGELFAREIEKSPGLELQILDLAAFDAMSSEARDALVQRLELPAAYTREKWRRGDLAVVGILDGRPAGIGWCARKPVFVPDIGREITPTQGECYIYEVFVHPDERGKKIAPAMLDHLSRYLRARDVYRAWALIERANSSSVRAFERARYVAVADVVYVTMGLGSHLFVRPPDPEARALLGL